MMWQHLAPRLYPELKARYDEVVLRFQGEGSKMAHAADDVLAEFDFDRLNAPPYKTKEIEWWLMK